jgi:hypothetical protein
MKSKSVWQRGKAVLETRALDSDHDNGIEVVMACVTGSNRSSRAFDVHLDKAVWIAF